MATLIHKKPDGSERRLEIGAKPLVIGRLPESDISVRDAFVSRVHSGIGFANNQFTLKDLGSTNGTYRNGARVFECNLAAGDKIQVGNTALVFELETGTGNPILRQVPQMVAPATSDQGTSPPRPGPKSVTMPVKVPGQPPPARQGPAGA
jgi:pSer/pThr/pTyr-binding forkhead associated (FHA) protein